MIKIKIDEDFLEHYPIKTDKGLYVIAPCLIGQKNCF